MNERDQIIEQSEAYAAALRSVLQQLEAAQQDIHRICGIYRTIGDECADALAPIIDECKAALGEE